MFAVIKTGGKQYRVAPEDKFTIERIPGEAGDLVTLNEVLMVGSTIGAPFVSGASVSVEIVEQTRGKKVISFKKRRRQNSKRTRGHRQDLTMIRIAEILTDGKAPSAKSDVAAKPQNDDAAEVVVETPETPMFTAPEGDNDKLTKIKGIGPVAEKQLNAQGITTFAQIAAFTDEDIERIDAGMPFSAAQISDWREQAKALAAE
ncbi:50S ribosomal protein L21 [Aurantimonas sp. 22II-16-19i]|uniref:50S ribosomal protein L21 n=1 Tax=Aurantimonas sp. 22II-16-19i TaxID=1317114 RepID=UPI0009F7EC63|nr:50S ribosomal protein L21 [Aurantimonas sp. 22II-16-19i]ORE98435.1 50S ribosomal protein L21/unknown domain fusion protein [Aurantimonas sp. 22II-16-19i]